MCDDDENEDIFLGLDVENPNEEGFIDDDCEPVDPWYRFGERTTGPI